MKSVWKGDDARATLASWHDKFRAQLAAPTESRTVATRFGPTHVLVGGAPSAPPLVILHGALASSAHLLLELQHLLAHFRIYAVDVVGQSVKSADARPSVANNEYGEWLVEVVDQLGLDRFALLGVSWGGFVATRFAVVAPSRITHLALLVPAGIVKGSAWAGLTKLAWPMTMYRLFPSEKRLAKFTSNLLTTADDALWRPYLGEAFRSYNLDMRVPMLAKPEELAALTAPTLVVAADRDVSFPGRALLDRARVLFPNCREELLENCLHSPPTTDEFRRSFGDRLTAFFQPPGVTASQLKA